MVHGSSSPHSGVEESYRGMGREGKLNSERMYNRAHSRRDLGPPSITSHLPFSARGKGKANIQEQIRAAMSEVRFRVEREGALEDCFISIEKELLMMRECDWHRGQKRGM